MSNSKLFPVEKDTLKSMLKVYNRTEETFKEDISTLKKWMETQPDLPEIMDDDRIGNFLFLNKFNIENTKQKIVMYYTIRSLEPDFYKDTNPNLPVMQELVDICYEIPLPQLTQEMYRVLIIKLKNKELVDQLDPRQVWAHILNIDEIRLKEDFIFGDILISDFEDWSDSYISKITPTLSAKFFDIYEKVFSTPLRKYYIVNSNSLVKEFAEAIKKIVKPELAENIYVCEDTSILLEHFPKTMLPKDYGGNGKSCAEIQKLVKTTLKKYKHRFDELDKMRVNEQLRPESGK